MEADKKNEKQAKCRCGAIFEKDENGQWQQSNAVDCPSRDEEQVNEPFNPDGTFDYSTPS